MAKFLLIVLICAVLLLILGSALTLWALPGSDVVRLWEKMRAGELAASYIGIPLIVLLALAVLIALLRPAFGRKRAPCTPNGGTQRTGRTFDDCTLLSRPPTYGCSATHKGSLIQKARYEHNRAAYGSLFVSRVAH